MAFGWQPGPKMGIGMAHNMPNHWSWTAGQPDPTVVRWPGDFGGFTWKYQDRPFGIIEYNYGNLMKIANLLANLVT